MKKILLSTISLAALTATSAFSADTPSIKSALVASPAPIWTGFYAGLSSGYNFGTNNNSFTTGYGPDNFSGKYNNQYSFSYPMSAISLTQSNAASGNQSGFIGGGQVGYNYQLQQKFVVGVEADIQGAGISGSGHFTGAGINGAVGSDGIYYSTNSAGQTSILSSVNWLGTVRARLGYLMTPVLLAYGTGGLTYGGVKAELSSDVYTNYIGSHNVLYPFEGSQTFIGNSVTSETLVGWNVGGGLEWMFMPNWSLKSEAIYWNLGNINLSTTSVAGAGGAWNYNVGNNQRGLLPIQGSSSTTSINYQGIIARAGINYHFDTASLPNSSFVGNFISKVKQVEEQADSSLWTSLYAGLSSGYDFGTNSSSNTSGYGPDTFTANDGTNSFSYSMTGVGLAQTGSTSNIQNGFVGGGQIGYNYQLQQKFVVGVEADIQGAGIKGSKGFTGSGANGTIVSGTNYDVNSAGQTSISSSVNWLGTVRGRLGYLMTPALLAYGSGGLTYGDVKATVSNNIYTIYTQSNTSFPFEGSQTFIGNSVTSETLVGWNVGGGLEWMFMPNWSLKSEAIYWNLGNINLSTTSVAGAGGSWFYRISGQQNGVLPTSVSSSTTSINFQGVIARAGVNYHFNMASAPVVAKF